ncbi:unnamed protein product [[Candida] boidinii]|nr:unnamed protein product [[Candida] boidinii]
MEKLIRQKQKEIVAGLETLETKKFRADSWERGNNGGGGTSCVIQDGATFEKGGVNVSAVYGVLPPAAIESMKNDHKNIKPSESGILKL